VKDAAEAVIRFNQELLGHAPRPIGPMSDSEFEHLQKCLKEEFNLELMEAHNEGDVVKAVDAIIDGIYFALGGLYKMGLTYTQIDACFFTVHEYNMKKKRGQIERRATSDVPDAIHPEGIEKPEVEITRILGLAG
jgi:predicted HAD superfamily Cof-like phosphohydrolase